MNYFLFLLLTSCFLLPSSIHAQTPTVDSPDNIQTIREVVQQKVMEKLKQITNPGSRKVAIVGKVIQMDTTSITIEYKNSTRKLTLTPETVYVSSTGSKISLDKIKVGQDIIAMGINDSDTLSFSAKRIVATDLKKVVFSRTIVVGKVVDVSRTTPVFTLISNKNKNSLFQIKTDTKTDIGDKNQQKIKLTDVKAGQKMIAILTPDTNISKTYYALKLVNLDYLPPEASIKPSASPTAKP